MRVVESPNALAEAISAAEREATSAFGDGRVYIEKYLATPHHIEVQVFGDGRGRVVHLGERECSVQRRHQKIIEEAPAADLAPTVREQLTEAAVKLATAVNYEGAGTVEFITDGGDNFYFLEMNTRLQVEHAVTEMTRGVDLVAWQLDVADGKGLPELVPERTGHAIECRIYAEDPANGFLPTAGEILLVDHPSGAGIRVDTALYDGLEPPIAYDPMLAKIVCWGQDRDQARRRMIGALESTAILGITTNVPFLIDMLDSREFVDGSFTTTTVERSYSEWRAAGDDISIPAALASVAPRRGWSESGPGANGIARVPGPWETLGDWRLGDSAGTIGS